MKTLSSRINEAIEASKAFGIDVQEMSEGWSKIKQVVHMTSPAPSELISAISSIPQLRRWDTPATPHDASACGFTDDETLVAITFPAC